MHVLMQVLNVSLIDFIVYSQDCNNFLAGNMLRSNSRFRALDETALFGSACRHEFPAIFFNLKHGERYNHIVKG